MEMDSIETMGVDATFEHEVEMEEVSRSLSQKKKKSEILADILNQEPLLIGSIAKTIVDGKAMQVIRAAFIRRLDENPEIVKKHGGVHPMKIWHPEFLTAVHAVLSSQLADLPEGDKRDRAITALKIMDERSEEARALREVARRKKEAGEKPARRKKKKD